MITIPDVVTVYVTNLQVLNASRKKNASRHYRQYFEGQAPEDALLQRYVGLLGQEVAADYYGASLDGEDYDHDVTINGRTVDFKTHATTAPWPNTNRLALLRRDLMDKQRCDDVMWLEVTVGARPGGQEAWLYGWLPKAEYRARATLVKVGKRLGGFVARGYDTFALPYHELNPPATLGAAR